MLKSKSKLLTMALGMIILLPCILAAAEGDVDGSGKIDLKDVIAAIQVCAGMTPTSAIHGENDADGDGKIGLADAIFALAAVPSLTVTQKAEVGYYTAGQELTVIADIVYTGGVSSMGGTLDLPDTWEYVTMDGDMPTTLELLANGDLRFYWVGVPASPVSFTYKVKVPAGTTGNYPIDMQIRYLHRGKEETPVYSSLWIDSYIPPVPITTYCITVTSEGNGKITPAGSTADNCYAVPESEKVTFTMTPVDGFAVKDVLVDGVSVGAVTSYTFEKVAAKHTVHAKFTSGKIRATWTPAEGGKILVEGLTAKMIPNEGYTLEDVKVNGVSVGSVLTYTFDETCSDTAGRSTGAIAKIEKDCWWPGACDNDCWWPGACDNPIPVTCTIFAIFKAKGNYTITVTAGNNGTVTPGTVSVLQGADQKFEIKANNGYYVANVLVDGESVGARADYTFEDVNANHTLDAQFTNVCGNIATSGFNGKIVLQGLKAIIVPNTGYEVEDVRVNGISRGSVPTYTLPECEEEPPAEECCYSVIHATFKKSAITVTVVEPENGFAIVTVNPDGTRKLTIIPDEGYSVKDVTLDGISVGKVLTYDFPAGDTAHAVVVTLVTGVPQHLITATAGKNGKISPIGDVAVNEGDSQTFVMIPDDKFRVVDVVVDGKSLGDLDGADVYTFENVKAPHTINVAFTDICITATWGEGGKIIIRGMTAIMIADPGYQVKNVDIDGKAMGSIASYTFDSCSNHTVYATFQLSPVTLTYGEACVPTAEGQHGIATTVVDQNNARTVVMFPNTGYVVADVLVDGVSKGSVNTYTFAPGDTAHTVCITFKPGFRYTITASAEGEGSITPAGTVWVNAGESQSFTMYAFSGYFLSDVHVDGVSVGAVQNYSFANVGSNHSIHAVFMPRQYIDIIATAGANGMISPSGTVAVDDGGNQTFTMKADEGYVVDDVKVDGVSVGARTDYTFVNVSRTHTIHVTFKTAE